jgi:hypothetical protein
MAEIEQKEEHHGLDRGLDVTASLCASAWFVFSGFFLLAEKRRAANLHGSCSGKKIETR